MCSIYHGIMEGGVT